MTTTHITGKGTAMTDVLTLPAPRTDVRVRRTAPSLTSLIGLEVRKSLSTRSGKSLAAVAVLIGPAGMALLGLTGDQFPDVLGPLAVVGVMTGLLLLALGVLSTGGEWTHRTVQTTFLLVPRRGRVLAAKEIAVALLGVVLAAVSAGLSLLVLSGVAPAEASWDGLGAAVPAVLGAGAAFAMAGAGVGAATGNTAAALTGLYLLILGAMQILRVWNAELVGWIDPVDATLMLVQGMQRTQAAVVLAGWMVVSAVAGWLVTRRRQVG
ncbi:hypothetical protein QOZ88_19055 [Blastococcus sp. BMG 814]|uniref:ABC-2 type transport system permease protein n=1 Tax=Blastococcus carthaginiensis TaxID=3050034 RepID=A0ABT9IGN0_9ACTN|nr:hypothetical protein [Blastococcus carthaginiensis]MDP5184739.1 hypothetical protein [Blastococcus carthaginiensis]